MQVNDYVQLGLEIVALAGFGFGAWNRWAVANHRDRLAMFTSAAANAAGRIRLNLATLPPAADAAAGRAAIQVAAVSAAASLMQEFGPTAAEISGTEAKATDLILAHIMPAGSDSRVATGAVPLPS